VRCAVLVAALCACRGVAAHAPCDGAACKPLRAPACQRGAQREHHMVFARYALLPAQAAPGFSATSLLAGFGGNLFTKCERVSRALPCCACIQGGQRIALASTTPMRAACDGLPTAALAGANTLLPPADSSCPTSRCPQSPLSPPTPQASLTGRAVWQSTASCRAKVRHTRHHTAAAVCVCCAQQRVHSSDCFCCAHRVHACLTITHRRLHQQRQPDCTEQRCRRTTGSNGRPAPR
jgi:hypothetical protein